MPVYGSSTRAVLPVISRRSPKQLTLYQTKKADIIAEILMQQGGEADADP